MANYTRMVRTNYFHVTDETRYNELFNRLVAIDDYKVRDFTEEDQEGNLIHGFGTYGLIGFQPQAQEDEDDFDWDLDQFCDEMQKILPEDEAMFIIENGHEKLHCLKGIVTVVTSKDIKVVDVVQEAKKTAGKMLGLDHPFATQTEY